MATFEFDLPNGKKAKAEGNTPEEAWRNYNFANPPAEDTGGRAPNPAEHGRKLGNAVDVLRGIAQGWLDPVEGVVQLAEQSTGWHLAPDRLRNWARDYRNRAQSTWAGIGGEVAGNIFNPVTAIPGAAVGRAVGAAASRLPGAAATAGRALTAERAGQGAVAAASQPVSGGGDYWRAKANQTLVGGAAGAALPALAGAAARGAERLPTHFSWHHPVASLIGSTAGPTLSGVAGQAARLTPEQTGRLAGEATGETEDDQ